jgi:hypothetical protein
MLAYTIGDTSFSCEMIISALEATFIGGGLNK